MLRILCLTLALTTPAHADETGLWEADWMLVSIDGAPLAVHVILRLDEAGKISGQGPCNRYFGTVQGVLPEFHAQDIGSTKMACPDLGLESQYFQTLQAVDHAEIIADALHLTGGGHALVFQKPLE